MNQAPNLDALDFSIEIRSPNRAVADARAGEIKSNLLWWTTHTIDTDETKQDPMTFEWIRRLTYRNLVWMRSVREIQEGANP